jgi:hypothetical protein
MQRRLEWLLNNGYIEDNIIKYTRTTRFLMPLIGVSELELKKLSPEILINAHIKSKEEKLIYIILNKKNNLELLNDFLQNQNFNENFVDYIEEEDEFIVIYKLQEHFYSDYDKILTGQYSKTSDSFKEIITRIYGYKSNEECHLPSIYDALYPTDKKRKMYAKFLDVDHTLLNEISSIPNLEYEIYKPIKQLYEQN